MKNLILLTSLVFLFSCGKTKEKKEAQTSLQLSGIQSTGVNLGAASQGNQKYVVVTCSNQASATNTQRASELNNLLLSIQNGSYVNFTIVGTVITPTQMQTLLRQASQNLSYSYGNHCPSNYLASIPVN